MFVDDLKRIKEKFFSAAEKAKSDEDLLLLEKEYLGRKRGALTAALKKISSLSKEEKKQAGQAANELKKEILAFLAQKKEQIFQEKIKKQEKEEWLDVTLPGKKIRTGKKHPLTSLREEIEEIFLSLGFLVLNGPELESEYYNFEALNIPDYHPARDMQDTFYLKSKDKLVLRTHTSSVQARALEKYGAPFRAIVPGRVFRYEATDASHDNTFYQIEGLMVDKDINLSHLKGIMQEVLSRVFQKEVKVRFRPGYFPFVEPGLELDLGCPFCNGKGCSVCKKTGWIEFMGAGMVHPNVLRAGGVDPQKWQGFAFGFGLTRLAMMKFNIQDIRLLTGYHLNNN